MSEDGSITDHYFIGGAGRIFDESRFPACHKEAVLGSGLRRQGEKIGTFFGSLLKSYRQLWRRALKKKLSRECVNAFWKQ
jgi:hypothetical protein